MLVDEEILKSLHRLKVLDSDLSTGLSYPAFEQLGPGLKTSVENGIFWSEIGSGFGEPGGTPLPRIPRRTPPPPPPSGYRTKNQCLPTPIAIYNHVASLFLRAS